MQDAKQFDQIYAPAPVDSAAPIANRKAVLLLAALLPGAGHLYLRRFRRGAVYAGIVLACTIPSFFSDAPAIPFTMPVLPDVDAPEPTPVPTAAPVEIPGAPAALPPPGGLSWTFYLALAGSLVWTVSVVDAVRATRRKTTA